MWQSGYSLCKFDTFPGQMSEQSQADKTQTNFRHYIVLNFVAVGLFIMQN